MHTEESFYQEQLQLVAKIYERYAQKDITALSPRGREDYRIALDQTRHARAALESNRPLKEKLVELNLQLQRPCPSLLIPE